jgi:hypothetical protein
MTRMWISFANFGDPNMNLGGEYLVVAFQFAQCLKKKSIY